VLAQPMTRPMPHVIVYERDGCCLCEQARELLERIAQRTPFTLERRDIEADERLLLKYLERIPVVVINGREAFELIVDEAALESALRNERFCGNP
jgi:glutaredoxin